MCSEAIMASVTPFQQFGSTYNDSVLESKDCWDCGWNFNTIMYDWILFSNSFIQMFENFVSVNGMATLRGLPLLTW